MRQFNEPGEGHKLDQVDIHSAGMRRSSLPSSQRPQSLKHVSRPQGPEPSQSRPLYEETYYISGLKDNYLTLISDNMEILQLPLGLIQENIKMGCPIKLRLEYDQKRQQGDDQRFKMIQKELYEEFRERPQKGD